MEFFMKSYARAIGLNLWIMESREFLHDFLKAKQYTFTQPSLMITLMPPRNCAKRAIFFLSVSHKVCHQYNKDLFIALVEEVSGGVVKPYKTSKMATLSF